VKVGIESGQVAKQNLFNCRTWNGRAARGGTGGDVRRESSGVSKADGSEGRLSTIE
jgi:hypothetical protein